MRPSPSEAADTVVGDADDLAPDVLASLGLSASDEERVGDDREAALAGVADLWPAAAIALIAVPLALVIAAAVSGAGGLAAKVALVGLPALLAGPGVFALLRLVVAQQLATHHRVALIAGVAAAAAASLFTLSQLAGNLTDHSVQMAAVVALFGTMIVTVAVIHPLPAATLGFAAALAAATVVRHGLSWSSAAAIALTGLLACATWPNRRKPRTLRRSPAGWSTNSSATARAGSGRPTAAGG
jgi:hypothetical protein